MAAASGIGISPELTEAFATAIESNEARFLKVAIRNGQKTHVLSSLELLSDVVSRESCPRWHSPS